MRIVSREEEEEEKGRRRRRAEEEEIPRGGEWEDTCKEEPNLASTNSAQKRVAASRLASMTKGGGVHSGLPSPSKC